VAARPEDDPLFLYLDGEMRDRLTKATNELPERERLVITLYHYEETTMKEVGLILGVVESRVSQIHASAILPACRPASLYAGRRNSSSLVRLSLISRIRRLQFSAGNPGYGRGAGNNKSLPALFR
jgi:hypothetical protein